MRPRRGTAITPDASADLLLEPTRQRQGARPAEPGRFSPLNAPQRALVEAFLGEARPWAMRQARRAFRHLPVELQEQGYENATLALRTGAPPAFDRRTLYAELARHLDDELRGLHVGWCLNQAPTQAPPTESGPSHEQPVAAFVEDGLGGLERAVLQLELGAGRDTSTVRAALRLGPRQYARHREIGLGKLRGAITGSLRGRVCEQHLDSVTLAATGDRAAADGLATGPDRCRACAREASGLRRVLQQRLALAPWPLAVKPVGAIAAKLGAVGAALGGKGAAGSSLGGSGLLGTASGAKVVASVVAAAAVASGGIAAVETDGPQGSAPATRTASAPVTTGTASKAATRASAARAASSKAASARGRAATKRRKATRTKTSGPAATAQAQAKAQAQHPSSPEPTAPATQPKPTDDVRRTVDRVKKTVDDVTGRVPVTVPKVDEIAPAAGDAVDDVTKTVDDLLTP